MPYSSEAQRKYFNANREKLEAEGVDVDEWNETTKGKKLPKKLKEKGLRKKANDTSFLPKTTQPLFPGGQLKYQPTKLKLPEPLAANKPAPPVGSMLSSLLPKKLTAPSVQNRSLSYADLGDQLLTRLPIPKDQFLAQQKANLLRDRPTFPDPSGAQNLPAPLQPTLISNPITSKFRPSTLNMINPDKRNEKIPVSFVQSESGVDGHYSSTFGGNNPKAFIKSDPLSRSYVSSKDKAKYHGFLNQNENITTEDVVKHELGHHYLSGEKNTAVQKALAEDHVRRKIDIEERSLKDVFRSKLDKNFFVKGKNEVPEKQNIEEVIYGPRMVDGKVFAPTYSSDLFAEKEQGALSALNGMRDVTGQLLNTPQQVEQLFNEVEQNPRILNQMPAERVRYFREYLYKKNEGDVDGANELKNYLMQVSPYFANKEQQSLSKVSSDDEGTSFLPDYTPEQLKEMGVYKEVYGAKDAPRLASLPEWPAHWYNEADPHGWLQWYDRHSKGRRIEDDKRQIKRWISFKARHGGKAFRENPTPRRAFALRNWGIDPAKLVDDPEALKTVMDEYKTKKYNKTMEKVSFLPKLAKDEKPGLWANIRAKRKRGEPPAKPGDKAYPDKEQWSDLTKKEAGNIAPSVLPNKVPDKPFVPSVMDSQKQMMGNVFKNIKASDPNAKSLLTNKNLWKFVGSIPSQYGDLLTGDMKGLSKTYNRFGANIKEGRCWDGYEPVPGKKPYAPDSCRKKTKKKDKSKKADLFESLEKTPFRNTAAAGLIGLGVVPAMAALGGGYGYLFPDKPNEGEDLQKKKIETAKRQALVAAILSSGLLLGKGIRDDISASMKKADLSFLPKVARSPAWQRSEGKNSEGGLNAKGRASYNRENGGNLKAPVTEKNPSGKREKRQNSFCSRMCGMKKSRTSDKTKNDPDSRINKALRKWRCRCA